MISTGVGITLIAVGAILRFAAPATFIIRPECARVSVIVMLAGIFGLLLSLLVWGPLDRRRNHYGGVAAEKASIGRRTVSYDSIAAGPVTAGPRAWRGRVILRAAVPAALIAAVFGLALPRVASYRAVWASIDAMTWPYALLVGTAAAASMVTYWITIRAVLPWIGLRQAAAVSLGSNAVASTLPVGGAVAVGVGWAMLSSWGLSTADYVLYTLVTGIWNLFILTGLPVLAVLVMATASRPDATMITGAAVGLALLAAMAGGLALLLHSEASALRAGRVLQYGLAIAARLARRAPPASAAGSLPGFRDRASALLAARGWRITAADRGQPPHAVARPAGMPARRRACPRPSCPGRPPWRLSPSSGCSPPYPSPQAAWGSPNSA